MTKDYDVAVVGGGLLGSAIAWGLGRLGQSVAVLDEGDITKRASRANFALVWVQSKGLGMPAYTGWTVRASQAWRMRSMGANALASYIVLAWRPRPSGAPLATRKEIINLLRHDLPKALRNLQHGNRARTPRRR